MPKGRGLTPRYCLYSHSPYVDQSFLNCCSRRYPKEELGCTITSPAVIERAIASRGGKGFQSLQGEPHTVPWRCLTRCPRLQRSLLSRSISPENLAPLLDEDSIIYARLPDGLNHLREEGRRIADLRFADDPNSAFDVSSREVDFEQLGIGVDSSQMDYRDDTPPRVVIPRRVYIMEITQGWSL